MTHRVARLTAVVLALAGAGIWGAAVTGIGSAGAGAASADPSPSGRITLTQQTSWVGPGQSFQVRLAISSAVPRANLAVAVTVFDKLTSRSALSQTVQGHDVGVLRGFPPAPVTTLTPGPAGDVIVTIPIVSSPQASKAPAGPSLDLSSCPSGCDGVYPVQVELQDQAVNRALDRFTTHLVFAKAPLTGSKLGVSWILPAHAPPTLAPDGRRSLAPDQSRQLSELASSVAHHETVPVTLAPTPETMQALADSPRPTDHQTLATLTSVAADPTQQVLTGPYVPVSLPGLADVGLGDQATAQLARGTQVLGTTLHAQTNPLWHEEKIKNYLPHMTWPEVEALLTRTDMVIIPVASLEETVIMSLTARSGSCHFGIDKTGSHGVDCNAKRSKFDGKRACKTLQTSLCRRVVCLSAITQR